MGRLTVGALVGRRGLGEPVRVGDNLVGDRLHRRVDDGSGMYAGSAALQA